MSYFGLLKAAPQNFEAPFVIFETPLCSSVARADMSKTHTERPISDMDGRESDIVGL
jgi:hypothetical protein